MSEVQREIFDLISKNDTNGLKTILSTYRESIDFTDDNGMTPLQHAAYKGNKDGVQLLLDLGADVNSGKHEFNYTALHFAALSGNSDVCLHLLLHGANPSALNSVNRTAAQMAAFVTNTKVVSTINHFIPKKELEYYTKPQGLQTEPLLPPNILDAFHKLVIYPNIHPIRVALNLQQFGIISENYAAMKKVLDIMSEKEMKRKSETNEVMAFKYHYLAWMIKEIMECRDFFSKRNQEKDSKSDYLEMFVKRVLKHKDGQMDFIELTIRECVREFPFRECISFQQIVRQLADKENQLTAYEVVKQTINGQRGFPDTAILCSACGDENPDKKCSKCKQVQYCDRECQRIHWQIHKKECGRISTEKSSGKQKNVVDQAEISAEIQKLVAG